MRQIFIKSLFLLIFALAPLSPVSAQQGSGVPDRPNIAVLDEWRPQHWSVAKGGDDLAMVQDLYDVGIITDQYLKCDGSFFEDIASFLGLMDKSCEHGGVPVLEVGHGFMKLSMSDKLKIVEFIDYVYEITASPQGVFLIIHDPANEEIGIYTRHGLQLYQ